MIYIFVILSSICACQASGVHHNVQGSHIIQGAPVLQGPPLIQGAQVLRGPHLIQGAPVLQGPPLIQGAQVLRGPPLIQGAPVLQSPTLIQGAPVVEGPPLIQGRSLIQDNPVIQRRPVIQGAPLVHGPPVVTAASSQYFQRTFNRLILAQPVLEPIIPVAPPPTNQVTAAPDVPSTGTTLPTSPQEPNIAIAIATAHAAPVATFLLPPYPFAHALGFIPPSPPINVPEEPSRDPEPTTTTTQRAPTSPESNQFTGQPSNQDFGQALPDNQVMNLNPRPSLPDQGVHGMNSQFQPTFPNNQGVNFKPYRPPSPNHLGVPFNEYRPTPPIGKPQKLKTSVEIVPVPLAYIAPPPIKQVQLVKHVHKILPTKLVIRPVKSSRITYKAVSPIKLLSRTRPSFPNLSALRFLRVIQDSDKIERRDTEPTTFRPLQGISPITKPPKFR